MRITMIAPFGIRPKGTLLARMLPLAHGLARRGYTLRIVAPPVQNPEDAGTRQVFGAVEVLHTHAPRFGGPSAIFEQSALLAQLAQQGKPELLHLFKPKGYGGLAVLALQKIYPQVPLVVDTDDWEGWGGWNDLLPYPSSAKALFEWQERDLPRRAQAVTVASHTLREQVLGFGVPAERIFYVPNGADFAQQPPARSYGQVGARPTILLYTRFWELDLAELLAAFVEIHRLRPEARVLVVGKGEQRQEEQLAALAEQAGIGQMLDQRGWVQPAEIPGLMASADLALAPLRNTLINRARGLAKLLELMQQGLPIVASDVGQSREYLRHEQSALLVHSQQPKALAAAVVHLIDDAALRAQLGQGAQQAAAEFCWDNLASTTDLAYRYALAAR